jgi:hypothetical protein
MAMDILRVVTVMLEVSLVQLQLVSENLGEMLHGGFGNDHIDSIRAISADTILG